MATSHVINLGFQIRHHSAFWSPKTIIYRYNNHWWSVKLGGFKPGPWNNICCAKMVKFIFLKFQKPPTSLSLFPGDLFPLTFGSCEISMFQPLPPALQLYAVLHHALAEGLQCDPGTLGTSKVSVGALQSDEASTCAEWVSLGLSGNTVDCGLGWNGCEIYFNQSIWHLYRLPRLSFSERRDTPHWLRGYTWDT